MATANAKYSRVPSMSTSDSTYFMSVNSPYPDLGPRTSAATQSTYGHSLPSSQLEGQTAAYNYTVPSAATDQTTSSGQMGSHATNLHAGMSSNAEGMMIESHDVDVNALHHTESFPFSNNEILPWLEYLPQDVLSFFGENQNYPTLMSPDEATPRPPQ